MKKTTEQFAQELLARHSIILTSEYGGAHSTVTFTCPQGHENTAVATNLLQRGYKCKQCLTGRKITTKISWDEAKLQLLQTLFDRGLTTEQIAEQLNTTTAAIHNATTKFQLQRSRFTALIPEFLQILLEQGRELLSDPYTLTTKSQALIKCGKNHTVAQDVNNILQHQVNCPQCPSTTSKEEREILEYIQEIYPGWVVLQDRSILNGKELDIVLPDLGLAIEINGTYWHSEHHVDKYYHKEKSDAVEAFGFQLLHIFTQVWNTKKDIVKSKLKHLVSPSKAKIYARNTTIHEVSWAQAKEFLEQTHVQGSGNPTKYNYGLLCNGQIVALLTLQVPRFAKQYDLEIIRFSTSEAVPGAFSKLLKHACRQLNPESIITYALRDFSTGNLYTKNGFEFSHNTEPNYAWFCHNKKLSRYQAQAWRSLQPDATSEAEALVSLGYHRVWDSGSKVFIFRPPIPGVAQAASTLTHPVR